MWCQQNWWELFNCKHLLARFQDFSGCDATVCGQFLMKQVLECWGRLIQGRLEACYHLPGQCIVLSSGGETWESSMESKALASSFDLEGNWGQKQRSPCRLRTSVSPAPCTLRLWGNLLVLTCVWRQLDASEYNFAEGHSSRQRMEEHSSSASRLFLCKPRFTTCAKKKPSMGSLGSCPKSVRCFPHLKWSQGCA